MAYHSEDVQIVLPSSGGISISLWRRNRQKFRDRLLALGGEQTHMGGIVGIPVGWLEEVERVIAEEYPDWSVKVRDERPVQKRPGDRVRWADEVGGFHSIHHNGYVGRVKLFSIQRSHRRTEGSNFHLYTELPGYRQSRDEGLHTAKTQEEAERYAEGIVAGFLERIGATWKNEEG